jgi:transposase
MKCRLYPNKTQAKQIDNLIDATRLFHNAALHDILENKNPELLNEKKCDDGKVVHFINWKALGNKNYLNQLREQDPRIARLPGAAISGKVGVINDMKKALCSSTSKEYPIERFGDSFINKDGNKIRIGIKYHNERYKRYSYTYMTGLNNIKLTDNTKVIKIKLSSRNYPVDGFVKVKGFNNDLRFDSSCMMTFKGWKEIYDKTIRITISKDKCGDYYIVFLLPLVYKPIRESENKAEITGVDVGEKDLMITWDGTESRKYGNLRSVNKRIAHEEKGNKILDRRLSRREGWSNIDFREQHKKDKSLKPSKSYEKTMLTSNKLSRKISRQRKDYQSKAVIRMLGSTDAVVVEGLRVKDMIDRGKKSDKKTEKTS